MKAKRPHDYHERVECFSRALERDPSSTSAHVALAQVYSEAGELDSAISHWRAAIAASPRGPLTAGWKTQLKKLLEIQSRAQQGLKGNGFSDFKVCHHCQAEAPTAARVCPRCGGTLEMSFFQWATRRENFVDVARTAAPFVLVAWTVVLVVAQMPLEYKACLAMAGVIVGAWYFLKGIGGTTVD